MVDRSWPKEYDLMGDAVATRRGYADRKKRREAETKDTGNNP